MLIKLWCYLIAEILGICVLAYALIISFGPVFLGKVGEFSVRNESGQRIWISPVATARNGKKSILNHYVSRYIALPSTRNANIPLKPNQTKRLAYYWYDSGLSEIVVHCLSKESLVLTLDANAAVDQSFIPPGPVVIPPIGELKPVNAMAYSNIRFHSRICGLVDG